MHPRRNRSVTPGLGITIVLALLVAVAGCAGARSQHRPATSADPTAGADSATDPGATELVDPGFSDGPTTVDPGTLPQTRDHPGTTDAQFTAGVQALWQGIVADDPQQAMTFFFPLSAYLQVKAVNDPAHDWQSRLVAAYTRDIHALHAQVAKAGGTSGTDGATLVGLDVPDGAATWVNPGQEYNKLGYWRVYGSTLKYTVGGRTLSLPIYSLISWRGEWYVVHVTHP